MCEFGGDPAICVREVICAKVYRRTDRQTDDGRLAIVLARSWNELMSYQLLGCHWCGVTLVDFMLGSAFSSCYILQ